MEFNTKLTKIISERRKKELNRPKPISEEEKEENLIHWTTCYRRNINIYIHKRLGINLHAFQHVMIYLMSISKTFFAICSRGLAKTADVAIYAIAICMLKPYSEVVITASTIEQARRMVKDKMVDEIFAGKYSPDFPFLPYLYKKGFITVTDSKDEVKVEFVFNKSWIKVLPATDSSRGSRATVLIYEECRLLKKGIIDSVFAKMAHPRQAVFKNLPEYVEDERWQEDCQSIYITSARFTSEWFWKLFKKVVYNSFRNKKISYNFFAGDIFLAMMFGLKTKADYYTAKQESSELEHRMEDLNEMLGEAENPFFSREKFKKNQIIKKAFKPPKINNISGTSKLKNREKLPNETRLLFIDYAFANTTSKEDNDNTIIGCMYGIYEDKKIQRGVEYITPYNASDTEGCDHKIRELFWDYQCDYIVLDLRNGGETNYNYLTKEWKHPERNVNNWNSHGFTVVRDIDLNVVPQGKIDDLISRTIDSQAIPCIIPIVATAELNSLMWLDIQKKINDNQIDFLIEDIEFEQNFEDVKGYFSMTSEEKAEMRLPYIQTMLLINEAVNLSQEWKDGKVKLSEPRTGTKDRIVSCTYGNYVMSLIENKLSKNDQDDDYDISDWSFLSGNYLGY